MAERFVISDEAWAWLEPLLPDRAPRRGGRWHDHRQVVEAIAWKYRTGAAWRELPERFGPWQTAYERHNRWSSDGTWARLLAAAQAAADAREELDWPVAVDSSLMRCISTGPVHGGSVVMPRPPSARSRPPRPPQGAGSNYMYCRADPRYEGLVAEPGEHAIGRSRGGLTTKLHLLVDGRGRPLVLVLTAGNVNHTLVFAQLIGSLRVARPAVGRPRTRPEHLLGDKGHSSRANRALLRRRGISHTIPEPADQQAHRRGRGSAGGRPVGFDKNRYKRRNVVERGFCQLKHWRGLATRYDKHARNYLGAATLAALLTWLP